MSLKEFSEAFDITMMKMVEVFLQRTPHPFYIDPKTLVITVGSQLKLGGISIYIVKPVLDCKPVPVQIHDFAAARAHAAAHSQPVNHMDQDHM